MDWQTAVLAAVRRLCRRNKICQFTRRMLIDEELTQIVADTQSVGATPEQTLSRVPQELRQQGYIAFVDDRGIYVLI